MSIFAGTGELGALATAATVDGGVPVNLDDVERWVAMLPLGVRELLAEGPIERDAEDSRPDGCRVCQSIRLMDGRGQQSAGADFLDIWHGGNDVVGDHYGLVIYLRCLLIYTLAGWAPWPEDTFLECVECGWAYPFETTPDDERCSQCNGRLEPCVEMAA